MMYCFDTSGITNPLQTMPQDIYVSMWDKISTFITSGKIVVTEEIYGEMALINGPIGDCIRNSKALMVMEVNQGNWDWNRYIQLSNSIIQDHHDFISEYTGGSPKTVCLNDISIIALAKTLQIPVVSMETFLQITTTKRRIPNVCKIESVRHLNFNEFLREEKIQI